MLFSALKVWTARSLADACSLSSMLRCLSHSVARLIALVRLFFGALQRGRDSFFPAATAGCVLFALVQSFAGPGLLRPAAILCLSVIVGLGLSQSVSQSSSR